MVRPILDRLSRNETKRPMLDARSPGVRAAITCGMPEPAAPGTQRRVTASAAVVHKGVQIKGSHQARV